MPRFVRVHRGHIAIKGHRTHHHRGSGVRTILHHRMKDTYDPNLEILKDHLKNMKISRSGAGRIKGSKAKKHDYIVF